MWTSSAGAVSMFTHVTNVHKHTNECMFVRLFLSIPGCGTAELPNPKNTKNNENVKSPKNSAGSGRGGGEKLAPLLSDPKLQQKKLPANEQTAIN